MSLTNLEAPEISEKARWQVDTTVEQFSADVDAYRQQYGKEEGERRFHEENRPDSVVKDTGNVLTTVGCTALWNGLKGSLATAFDNSNAYIGVGDSATAAQASDTDLLAATNKYRQVQDSSYPQVSGNQITFKITVATGNANFAWNEWGVFNASVAGTMLNRKAPAALGTKTSAASWAFTVTITLT